MSNTKQNSIDFIYDSLRNYVRYDDRSAVEIFDKIFSDGKEMHKAEIDESYREGFEFALINESAQNSTINASSYSEGYKEGYNRAIALTQWAISNLIPEHNKTQ